MPTTLHFHTFRLDVNSHHLCLEDLVDIGPCSEGQSAGQEEIDADIYSFGHIASVVAMGWLNA